MNVEFVDEAAGAPDGAGGRFRAPSPRRRRARRLAGAGAVLAAAALGTVAVLQRTPAQHVADAGGTALRSPPSAPTAAAPAARSVRDLGEPLRTVYRLAAGPPPVGTQVRADAARGSCRPVPVGVAPPRVAARDLVRVLPGYRVLDVGRTVNRSAGLCGFTIRARSSAGTTAVMVVTSPSALPPCCGTELLDVGTSALGVQMVQYARFSTPDRWSVLLGTVGPRGRQPRIAVLENLVSSPRLRW